MRITKGKYEFISSGRTYEVINANASWVVADITRLDARTVIGEGRTLAEAKAIFMLLKRGGKRKGLNEK